MSEWVVYRICEVDAGYDREVGCAPAKEWDLHMETLRNRGHKSNLTLLARGLTQEQAKAMARLAYNGEDDG